VCLQLLEANRYYYAKGSTVAGRCGQDKIVQSHFKGERTMKGRPMKVVLRVYKLKETLDREFSSFDEAQRAVEVMVKKDPDLIVQPYVQLSDSCEIDIYELGKD
jgi:hypothetical protein